MRLVDGKDGRQRDSRGHFFAAVNLVQCLDMRRIRTELRRLDLDWDSPLPPAGHDRDTRPLQVELVSEP